MKYYTIYNSIGCLSCKYFKNLTKETRWCTKLCISLEPVFEKNIKEAIEYNMFSKNCKQAVKSDYIRRLKIIGSCCNYYKRKLL